MERGVFVERPMSPQLIVVGSILRQNPTQVRFTQNDYMVDALAPDRSDQPFSEAALPRRGWGDGLVTDAHGAHPPRRFARSTSKSITSPMSLVPKLALFERSYGYGLTPLFCFNDPHRHSLAFRQTCQLRSFDNRDVHEDVFAAI